MTLVLGMASILATSSGKPEGKAAKDGSKIIGVTLLTVQHQFYRDLRSGLEDEAKKHGYKLLVSTAEFDPTRQANQIDEFIVQKPSRAGSTRRDADVRTESGGMAHAYVAMRFGIRKVHSRDSAPSAINRPQKTLHFRYLALEE